MVQLTWLGPDGILGTTDDVVYTDTTDANGAYQFTNLPMGNFEVMVLDGVGTPIRWINEYNRWKYNNYGINTIQSNRLNARFWICRFSKCWRLYLDRCKWKWNI